MAKPDNRAGLFARRIAAAVVAVALVAAIVWIGWQPPASPQPWNVLVITIDTTRADRIGCYGYPTAQTPNIDRLSREGIRYDSCYAPAPLTLPAHCSLLTGLVPPRHGVQINGEMLSDKPETLAEIPAHNGYETDAVVGAFVLDSQFGLARGFAHYDCDMSHGEQSSRLHYVERNAQAVTDVALELWNRESSEPKFLWVHYFDPHDPYRPPNYDRAAGLGAAYDGEIAFVDRHLGRLLSVVGASERGTLIILTSDHGEGLLEHGEQSHGFFTYNGTLRVPLIVRSPDGDRAGEVVSQPVGLVDVMPSILHWLKLIPPEGLDGLQLPHVQPVSFEESSSPRPIYFVNRYVERVLGCSHLEEIIAGNWKFISAPRPEVYELATDPGEETNLFDASDSRSQELTQLLEHVVAEFPETSAPSRTDEELDRQSLQKLQSLWSIVSEKPAARSRGFPSISADTGCSPSYSVRLEKPKKQSPQIGRRCGLLNHGTNGPVGGKKRNNISNRWLQTGRHRSTKMFVARKSECVAEDLLTRNNGEFT